MVKIEYCDSKDYKNMLKKLKKNTYEDLVER